MFEGMRDQIDEREGVRFCSIFLAKPGGTFGVRPIIDRVKNDHARYESVPHRRRVSFKLRDRRINDFV
jgi:hypothetical protein